MLGNPGLRIKYIINMTLECFKGHMRIYFLFVSGCYPFPLNAVPCLEEEPMENS